MNSRFDHIELDEESKFNRDKIKRLFQIIEEILLEDIATGRSQSIALTKLEEAYTWASKAIRDQQIAKEKNK